ncbi:hypothetical protein [Bacillus solimangrovi]|uniref:Uncharacterized protein n=1 Tax=Bacillus solimangrovi TaxID=1305675 RepID=A0A1E5LAS9_9BACI|nr:hypothetical protein [Bacillus solimangrovi]OEH91187.1 hypothetical protein BFG57_06105 [Bacillus solimangrovi]
MDDKFLQIERELRQTQNELSTYLSHSPPMNAETLSYVKQELEDVNRALIKMDLGMYGTCEQSGKHIPLSMLSVLPTARTINEAKWVQYFCT